ncbi:MAG: dehydrogenase, partial [Gemmatimonadaceae bacterium]|nr:dehydrogenase [Chitinophagaceae bacterium]
QQAINMKEALQNDEPDKIGALLDFGFTHKKRMAEGITNQLIEDIYHTAREAGATGGKISGAGGGGFMTFYCPKETKTQVERAVVKYGGHGQPFRFTKDAMTSWTENIQP